ncbi:hypothetical protein BJV77DRAFT_789145 [Russula vinacea]|nr:hypothetical protein BJV77DRAFT_789145 [Russula vinacea]
MKSKFLKTICGCSHTTCLHKGLHPYPSHISPMSQSIRQDPEAGNNPNGQRDLQSESAPNQPLQREPNFGDSSGKLFSIYSNVAEDEDNKMVERWQKDADAILIFTGLFSAAVAALLAVTVMDLRPNSQDTSAFYLGNIYGILADPNATRASIPSPIAKPPPFSRPRYAVWVNSLWFLSLVMSLSCALWATSLHQWARRYIRLTQPTRCTPEKRARMRAFFNNGAEKMHIPWAVEGLPALLHLSLFLFFGDWPFSCSMSTMKSSPAWFCGSGFSPLCMY